MDNPIPRFQCMSKSFINGVPVTKNNCCPARFACKVSLFFIFLIFMSLCSLPVMALGTSGIHTELSFTDWYVSGLQGNAEGAFSFASKAGLTGVEIFPFMDGDSIRILKNKNARQAYVDAGIKYKVRISSVCAGDLWSAHILKSKNDRFSINILSQTIDLCKLMNIGSITIPVCGPGEIKGDREGTDTVVARLRFLAPKAESCNVVLAIETYLTAEENIAILDRVGSPYVQDMYDIGNSFSRGFPIFKEIRMLKGRFPTYHCKDYSGLFGKSRINFDSLKQALSDINFNGWTVLELEQGMINPYNAQDGYKYDADYLKTKFPIDGVTGVADGNLSPAALPKPHAWAQPVARIMPPSFKKERAGGMYVVYNTRDRTFTFTINGRNMPLFRH